MRKVSLIAELLKGLNRWPSPPPPLLKAFNIVALAGRVGRLGLAISLVSAVEEKVWYCTRKGYKPWLKPSKQDVRTHEEGGHTIWQNELQMLKV